MNNTWKRPKLKLAKTKSEWIWDMIGFSTYFGSIILLISIWNKLPDQVPGHYNVLGEVNRWGSKFELFILPAIGLFIMLFMQLLERNPQTHNYPERLNESNAAQFYLNSRKMMNALKNVCLIIFSLILFESISISLDWGFSFGVWILPLLLVGTTIPIIIGLVRQGKIK